ncbi:hypothetical protein J7394_19760 [Ruegeria sp. R13_0]|uniref:hypothetical protein n=1 Tax=Ruegeria sp. R13_0 TaxID=2821099 RepID=UPI001ADCF7DA|nr:hypothetical protein [Ruegeria sp. R13_0]MBO9436460.1 hypothetical protein [Ruegeria sp. R13_0]
MISFAVLLQFCSVTGPSSARFYRQQPVLARLFHRNAQKIIIISTLKSLKSPNLEMTMAVGFFGWNATAASAT